MAQGHITVTASLLLLFSVTFSTFSQQIDTAFLALSNKQNIGRYTRSIELQSRLYNGHDYIFYIAKNEEHPYFTVDDWVFGSIIYWGEWYENVPLLYDLSIDQVVTENHSGATIRLIGEKVESFILSGRTFVRLTDDKNQISDGFYEQLYAGKLKAYAKHSKKYKETLNQREVVPDFLENTRYYLVKDGTFHVIKSKGSLLRVLEDSKQEVKSFIRKNHIHFRDNRGAALNQIAAYYDSLKD